MEIKTTIKECHACARERGFWDDSDISNPEIVNSKLMLIVTELAEACEALRENKQQSGTTWKKDTFSDELTDAVIRIFDLCGALDINLEWQLKHKMAYNSARPYKHGKTF